MGDSYYGLHNIEIGLRVATWKGKCNTLYIVVVTFSSTGSREPILPLHESLRLAFWFARRLKMTEATGEQGRRGLRTLKTAIYVLEEGLS